MLAGSQRSHRLHKPQRFKALMPVKLTVYKVRQVQGTKGFNKPTQLRTQALLKDKGLVWCDDGRPGGAGTPAKHADFLPSAPPSGCPQRGPCAHCICTPSGPPWDSFLGFVEILFYETQGRI